MRGNVWLTCCVGNNARPNIEDLLYLARRRSQRATDAADARQPFCWRPVRGCCTRYEYCVITVWQRNLWPTSSAPVAITQNVACMKRQFNACQTPRSMYPSIFNSFPVIRIASAKNRRFFTYRSPHFCFPWRRPWASPGTQYVAWMKRQFNACQTPRSMYLSILNTFRVIRCLSQYVNPKIAIFYHILVSPGDAPGAITLNVVWMEIVSLYVPI